jgi:large subunit ribosomal protein L6
MSRVGKQPITIPSGVNVNFDTNTRNFDVSGPLGKLSFVVSKLVSLNIEPSLLTLSVENPEDKFDKAIWGTTRAIIQNLVEGVTVGFSKQVELNGVGYRMELASDLTLFIGFSHPVKVQIPKEISLTLEKNVLKGKSLDKQLIGNFFSTIHNMKPCDVYKQKGFKFPDRFYPKKIGKKGK